MKKLKGPLLLFMSAALLAACAGPRRLSQVQIGVWAAERDLWDEAIFRWNRVLENYPGSAVAHNNLAVAYEKKGLMAEARKEYELALKLAPNHREIKTNFQRFNLARENKEEKTEKKKETGEDKNEDR